LAIFISLFINISRFDKSRATKEKEKIEKNDDRKKEKRNEKKLQ